jgi:hypothetical protein
MLWQKFIALIIVVPALTAGTLHLKSGSLVTPSDLSSLHTDGSKHFRPGKSHYLLQFNSPIDQTQLDRLAANGAIVTGAIPDNAVMVVADDSFSTAGLDLEYAGHLLPEHKRSSVTGSAYIVEMHADVDGNEARALLTSHGVQVIEHANLLPNHYLVTGSTDGLEQWDEVSYIFPASDDLLNGATVYSCAAMNEVIGNANSTMVPMFAAMNHGWSSNGLAGAALQYAFTELTPKVASSITIAEITRALAQWQKVANVHFTPTSDPNAARTIAIKFASYDHGDGVPFDGPGGILAHTFYPPPTNAEPIAGDMHFDESEDWHSGGSVDIYTVALHEAGHALGLAHSAQPGAIMYPYYRFGAQISSDDIAGIQSLYGPPSNIQAPPPVAQPLTLTIQNPAGPLETTAATEPVSGITANATGTPQITWQTNKGHAGSATGNATWTIASVPLETGANTLTVTATDSDHHADTKTVVLTRAAPAVSTPVTPTGTDVTPPTLNLSSPTASIVQTSQPTISISGIASDNVSVAKVTWQNTLAGSGAALGTQTWTAANIPLYKGTNTLILRAYDAAGNSSWRSLTVVRQ